MRINLSMPKISHKVELECRTALDKVSPNEAFNADLVTTPNNGILLEISKEAFDKLTNGKFQDMVTEFRDSQKAELEQRQAEFGESGVVKSNVGRMIIPNIQLNEELVKSMSNMMLV